MNAKDLKLDKDGFIEDSEFNDFDDEELYEELEDKRKELRSLHQSLEPYEDDIEEDNYDGDSIELVTYVAETESEMVEIMQEMKKRDLEIPEDLVDFFEENDY